MDTLQINKLAYSNEAFGSRFAGTFPCDKLPTRRLEDNLLPQYFVINSCEANLNSVNFCHWVALIVYPKKIIYFDSSGLPTHLSNIYIRDFIAMQRKDVQSSTKAIQGFNSNLCGLFCLTFMACLGLNISLKSFLSFFKNDLDLDRNDRVVRKLFKKTFLQNN